MYSETHTMHSHVIVSDFVKSSFVCLCSFSFAETLCLLVCQCCNFFLWRFKCVCVCGK